MNAIYKNIKKKNALYHDEYNIELNKNVKENTYNIKYNMSSIWI